MTYLYYAVSVIAEYFSPLLSVCLVMRSSHQMRDLEEEEEEREEEAMGMLLETVVAHDGER